MTSIIQSLQINQLLWHASHLPGDPDSQVTSGYSQLDGKLNGGWPDKGIVELQADNFGIGEIRLLLPALDRLKSKELLYAWISPPGRLNGQALANAGLPLSNTLVATDVSAKEAFWLAEKSLRSGCCAAVILWCDELEPNQARRLQLAAKEGHSLGFIIRRQSRVEQSLPVSVRMTVTPQKQGLQVNIHKRIGGSPTSPFAVDMLSQWPELTQRNVTDNRDSNVTDISSAMNKTKRSVS